MKSAGWSPIFLAIVMAVGVSAQDDENIWMSLFNGKDLTNWTGYETTWIADSGMIRAQGGVPFNANTFIWYDEVFTDFVLKVKGRMQWSGTQYANSGIQIRSNPVDPGRFIMTGYQYELAVDKWGHIRGEACCESDRVPDHRSWFYLPSQECLDALEDPLGWQQMEMGLDGEHLWSYLNGAFCGEITDAQWRMEGYVGLQYHAPGGFPLDFKDIYIRPLNQSFTIPETLQVVLNDDGVPVQSAGSDASLPWKIRYASAGGMLTLTGGIFETGSPRYEISVFDTRGRAVLAVDLEKAEGIDGVSIDISALGEGVYAFSVEEPGLERYSALFHIVENRALR